MGSVRRYSPAWSGAGKVVVIQAGFNGAMTDKLAEGCEARLAELGVPESAIERLEVPGSFELPLAAQWACNRDDVDAVVAIGVIIQGDTAHFDYVCDAVTRGCTDVQLASGKPVGFCVLTCDTEQQAWERCGGLVGHKGAEAAEVVVQMIHVQQQLS